MQHLIPFGQIQTLVYRSAPSTPSEKWVKRLKTLLEILEYGETKATEKLEMKVAIYACEQEIDAVEDLEAFLQEQLQTAQEELKEWQLESAA